MLMQIATRTFESRVHLLDNGAKETNEELLDPGLSLRKKVEHSRAHGKKMERAACSCAQGAPRVAVRCSDLFEEGRTGHLAQPNFETTMV
jgi:hypothetical protein